MNKFLSTLAVASGLTGAAFLGGVAVSSIASAQDEAPPTTEQPAPDESAPETAPPEGCRGPHGRGPGLEAAAEAIGVSVEDLRAALVDGQTIAQVAEANGVDVQVVVDAMVAEAEEHLAEKVAAGELTQEEADTRLAELRERLTERVNSNELPMPGRFGGPRGEAPEDAPDAEGSGFEGLPDSGFAA